jgi:hypothetical protein
MQVSLALFGCQRAGEALASQREQILNIQGIKFLRITCEPEQYFPGLGIMQTGSFGVVGGGYPIRLRAE